MRQEITKFICEFISENDEGGLIPHIWREPLVCFGDAQHPGLKELRAVAHPQHVLVEEVLPEAKTIIAFFVPFTKEIGNGNKEGRLSSEPWAKAYEKTNAAISELNTALIAFLQARGVAAAVADAAYSYDEKMLMSKWSQRHVAYYCGLGTFGINNMLITAAGSCGRIGTVVTDLDVPHDAPLKKENCLYKRDGSCGICVERCPAGALTATGYDRRLCDGLCAENAKAHPHLSAEGSYALTSGLTGTNTCGKCVVGAPCTYKIPKESQTADKG